MGGCCSRDKINEGWIDEEEEYEEDGYTCEGDCGARVRLEGSCKFVSMFTQQGRKGVNQDAMTVWENFTGEQDAILCCVFDGHGPLGHKVASRVRDVLPSKLSTELASSKFKNCNSNDDVDVVNNASNDDDNNDDDDDDDDDEIDHAPISSCKASFIQTFKDMDKELSLDSTLDSFCSGATAVSIFVKGEHMIVSNLGDSRAVLCTRDQRNQLFPVQLTVDLKPNLPSEAERIKRCNGRVFAMEEEPDVCRLWLPDENSPGLAMSRAFGDFCLKDFGLIPIPQVSYRKLTRNDEFVVLATDGVWDVLSNKEVVKIVASAKKRSMAAKLLVRQAVRGWKTKYPTSKIDDCAVICLFLESFTSPTKSSSDEKEVCVNNNTIDTDSSATTSRSNESDANEDEEEWNALEGVSRVNTVVKLPRFACNNASKERSMEDDGKDE